MSITGSMSKVSILLKCSTRHYQFRKCCSNSAKKGLVLGVYSSKKTEDVVLTNTAKKLDECTNGKFMEQLSIGKTLEAGNTRIFWNLSDEHKAVCVVGLGEQQSTANHLEGIDENKEAIRVAAAAGCKSLAAVGITDIQLDQLGDAEAAAEGATLGTWIFQDLKNKSKQKPIPQITMCNSHEVQFNRGCIKAKAQNFARRLMETPANLMTPRIFAKAAESELTGLGVQVCIHEKEWIENNKMGSFLSVTRGSDEPPVFLEISYDGATGDKNPYVLIGKGVTFDSGGISLKPAASMDHMRADMGGAACVVATIKAVAQLQLPVNIKGLIPLCENMPSGKATKPGDVVIAMNGKSICVDNTDAEGRLILADALCYSEKFSPAWVLDIATLTGAMMIALGKGATGVFTNSHTLWKELEKAGGVTGDRVWRFPLWKCYTDRLTKHSGYDINNISDGRGGGSCTAAAFLREFVPEKTEWLHLDIAGVMGPGDDISYLKEGMTGRPTRTLVQFIEQLSTIC